MSKILIFGDICPTRDTKTAFDRGDRQAVFGEVLPAIEEADLVIGNLECAVSDSPKPIKKTGPILHTNTQSLKTLKDFDALSLANNHIRDCGDEGVMTAIETCRKMGIKTFGAGKDIISSREPKIIEKDCLKIGLMSFAEKEFNYATDKRPGACFLDPYYDFDRIRQFRTSVDYLIILYHGGIEYFQYPTPELRRKCRKMVECGADLVCCQHSHCIGTIEEYQNSSIVYGQGNSVFGYRQNDESWNRGLIIKVDIQPQIGPHVSKAKVSYRAIVASDLGLKWMDPLAAKELDRVLNERANASDKTIEEAWGEFCRDLGKIHLPLLLGWPRLFIAINRRANNALIKMLYGRMASNATHNLIRCDAHREVIEHLLSSQNFK